MKRVLITGAGGFVGARLARHLLAHPPATWGGAPALTLTDQYPLPADLAARHFFRQCTHAALAMAMCFGMRPVARIALITGTQRCLIFWLESEAICAVLCAKAGFAKRSSSCAM